MKWKSQSARGFIKIWQHRALAGPATSRPENAGPSWREIAIARLEAVLFLAREPLSSRKLAQIAGLADGTAARTLIRRLNRLYDIAGQAFRVIEIAGGYQLLTKPEFGPVLRKIVQVISESRLSGPAMETLVVVAYRQPVVRSDVEAIRGVQCDDILRQLLERDLVRIIGRSEDLGRPRLYGTTKRFLELFGLRSLEELPRAAQLQSASTVSVNDGAIDLNSKSSEIDIEPNSEEKSVTTRIRSASTREEFENDSLLTMAHNALLDPAPLPLSGAKDEDEEEADDEDEEWDDEDDDDDEADDDEEDEDDDFVDEEWEEVDDEDEDDEDEDDDDEEDDDWEDEDDDWDDDEEEEEEVEGDV
jgi:segregation and condensation protein B